MLRGGEHMMSVDSRSFFLNMNGTLWRFQVGTQCCNSFAIREQQRRSMASLFMD
jgi:hypothetical protein